MTNADIIEAEIKDLEQREINYNNAEKLAWLYIVRDHLSTKPTAVYNSGTKFAAAIAGKNIADVLKVVDELMSTLEMLSPKLYGVTLDSLNLL